MNITGLGRKGYILWLIAGIVTALGLGLIGSVAYAQGGYPQHIDPFVDDFAGLLTSNDAANTRTLLSNFKSNSGIHVVVVTINSIHDYNTGDKMIESFALNLFNTWGIGDRTRNDGVLILVAAKDRQVWIQMGSGYGHARDADMQDVIDRYLLPSFRRSEYSTGVYQGAKAVIAKLTGGPMPDTGQQPSPRPVPAKANTNSSITTNVGQGSSVVAVLGVGAAIAVAGAAGAWGWQTYARYRQRRCPNCQRYMKRLDEVSDDMYLDSGQKLEELLGTMDYDVWQCPNCNMHELHGYNHWASQYKPCPKCSRRTLEVTSETVKGPTYTSTGKKRISHACRNCKYHHAEFVVLPMLFESSSRDSWDGGSSGGRGIAGRRRRRVRSGRDSWDSGSSGGGSSGGGDFGGGSSDGGGASGSW